MRRLSALALVATLLAAPAMARADRIKAPQFALSLTFAGLTVADTALTIYGTSRLGTVEVNGFMRPFLENRRYVALWAVQAAGCAAILAGCHFAIHSKDKTSRIIGYVALVAVNIGRAYLVVHNLRLHSRIK